MDVQAHRLSDLTGASLIPLPEILTGSGSVLKMLSTESPHFTHFGEIYFSEALPGQIKAWRRHTRHTAHLAVPCGLLRLALYDEKRPALHDIRLGRPDHYSLLIIPPGLWFAFTALGGKPAMVANCSDQPHDPAEVEREPIGSGRIPYTLEGW